MSGWTQDELDLVQRLWKDGFSASQISAQLSGRTRNAVIGTIHRKGWGETGRAAPAPVQRAPKPVRPEVHPAPPRPSTPRVVHAAEARQEALSAALAARRALAERTSGTRTCTWLSDGPEKTCGEPALERGSYCSRHHALVYVTGSAKEPHLGRKAAATCSQPMRYAEEELRGLDGGAA